MSEKPKIVKTTKVSMEYISNPDNYGAKLIDDFVKYGLHCSKRNQAYIYYVFHAIIGQQYRQKYYFMFDELKIDLATPLIIFQDTGSGKTVLKHFVGKLCKDLKLNYKDVSSLNAGALIGTTTYDTKSEKTAITYGYLYDTNILLIDEADMLFSHLNDELYRDVAGYLQKAADSWHQGATYVHKKLTQGSPVEYFANCTDILGSYIPKSFNELATTTGLLPRHISLVKHITLDERIAVGNELIDSLNIAREETYTEEYDKIVARMQALKAVHSGPTERIEFTDSARERLKYEYKMLVEVVVDTSILIRPVIGGFLVRYLVMLMKLSCHNAIIRRSKQVEISDVAIAGTNLLVVWQTLAAYLEISLIQDEKEKQIYIGRITTAVGVWHELKDENKKDIVRYEKNDGFYVREESIIDKLREKYVWNDYSINAVRDYFRKFIRQQNQVDPKAFFQEKVFGKTKYVKLIRDLVL